MEIKNFKEPQNSYKEKRSENEVECNINMRTSAKNRVFNLKVDR
jgi:hypothetical protein